MQTQRSQATDLLLALPLELYPSARLGRVRRARWAVQSPSCDLGGFRRAGSLYTAYRFSTKCINQIVAYKKLGLTTCRPPEKEACISAASI